MKIVLQKPLWQILAGIIFSLMMLSNSAYAALPKEIQADKYKLLIADSLKSKKYEDVLKYIQKLEALKVKVPDSIMYYKGESYYYLYNHISSFDKAKSTLEKYITKTGRTGKYYKEALVLLGRLDVLNLDPSMLKRYGTPFQYAAEKGILYQVKAYLDDGSDPNEMVIIYGKFFMIPMQSAAAQGNYKVIKELLLRGANINLKNKRTGYTPLMKAVQKRMAHTVGSEQRHYECVTLLIQKGANVNITDNDGETALDIAIKAKYNKEITLLKKHGAKRGVDL